ncbi:acetate--CoA ligase family protein [Sphingomonas sp. CJ20]
MSSLSALFRPRNVAIVGASDRNPWGAMALRLLESLAFDGAVHCVNPRGGTAIGRHCARSAVAIGETVDAAFIAVPAAALPDALEDMAAAGIRYGVVVTSGFAEAGPDGAAEQARIFARARQLGVTLMGPNSLGFVNFADRVGLGTLPVAVPALPNPRVGLVSQSGATAGILTRSAGRNNVSLTHAVALGNEAHVDLSRVVDFLVEDAQTRAIAIFAETIRDPASFLAAARKALQARKPVVMLKVGVGELAAAVAQAHTGALVGNDRIFRSAAHETGITLVDTLEDLLATADFMAYAGVLPAGKAFAVASISGGACEMIADRGEDHGVPFSRFDSDTAARLTAELPGFATAHNPLDITGAAMADPDLFRRSIVAIAGSPDVALIGACFELPSSQQDLSPVSKPVLGAIGRGFAEAGVKGFLLQQTIQPMSGFARDIATEAGLPHVASGIGQTMGAVGAAFAWSQKVHVAPASAPPSPVPIGARPKSERETLDVLASAGVPVVPARIVGSRAAAVAAAREMAEPVVLKILSPDIAHKTEIGGVVLDLIGDQAVGDAYDAMIARVAAARPDARIDGVIVSPLRQGGLELFVGIARDPAWGLAIAVGFGGTLVELLQDSALRLLPVTPQTVREMLRELRGARLFNGYRGAPPSDLDAIAEAVARIGDVALALGDDLASLEVNPVWVRESRVECLDALALWHDSVRHRETTEH